MVASKNSSPQNPYDKANLFSKLFFLWILPLLKVGKQKNLNFGDLYNVRVQDDAETLGNELEKKWNAEVFKSKDSGKSPKLYRALWSIYGKTYCVYSLLMLFMECVLKIAQPILVRLYVKSFGDSDVSLQEQCVYATGVCLTSISYTMILLHVYFQCYCMSMKFRLSLTSLIFRKTLRLSRAAQGQGTLGHIINLVGNDVYQFDKLLLVLCYGIIGPTQLILLTYILWSEIGLSCFAGIGFIILLMPFQYLVGKYSGIFRFEISKRTDERARFMNEIITGIRVIKMYAWEYPFSSLISRLRFLEVESLTKLAFLKAAYLGVYKSAMKPIILLTIVVFLLTGNEFTADKVFFAVACFNTLLMTMLLDIPAAASTTGSCLITFKRIEDFLMLEEQEIPENMTTRSPALDTDEICTLDSSVVMRKVGASWTGSKPTLKNMNLEISGNKLVMVIGAVGSGKSSFLNSLIAELPISEGSCTITGTTSYAGQDAWIFSGNIRQNILFGRTYKENLYQEIIGVCALEQDFRQLPYGDLTFVGERGISLSGGQKARVNLARALYQDSDIVLLDDPLSAVDTKVSRHIFEKCIKKYLRGHLRILVTHQLQYLPKADYIIVFDEGEIIAQGTYQELQEQDIDFVSLIMDKDDDMDRRASILSIPKAPVVKNDVNDVGPEAQDEYMATGSIASNTYWKYYKSSESACSTVLLIAGFLIAQALVSFSDYWLGYWTSQEQLRRDSNFLNNFNETKFSELQEDEDGGFENMNLTHLWIYCGLVLGTVITLITVILWFFKYSMIIGINIHDKMFSNLVRSPTKFYDTNPSGRIMNRVTKDLSTVDISLPEENYNTISILLQTVGIVVVVIVSNYYIIIPTIVVVSAFYATRQYYVSTARELKRLDALSRSPLFTHLSSTFQGLPTVRAAKAQESLTRQFEAFQNINTGPYFLFLGTTRWFAVWLEMISIIYLFLVTYSFLVLSTSMDSGAVGLAISSILNMSVTFQWGMRESAEVENSMTSVERILEYAGVKPEAALESAKPMQNDWVKTGEIKFDSVSLTYDKTPVLKNLTFTIKGREKIGIVGRTGAGKSSIITALFRLTEPDGSIYIDGIRINDIGLHDLRKNISIIPQDPVLFSGTIRYNLDPFNQFNDCELWSVLEEVLLKDAITSLNFPVDDGGANFSVGERQLVCLARAILRRNRIVILDEATANVDINTDKFIQKTIRTKFSHCTILTIAHRLNSVMDCDRILVLDQGTVKEYDHPYILLLNETGVLSSMINQVGKSEANNLRATAARNFKSVKLINEVSYPTTKSESEYL